MSSRNKADVKKLFEYWCEVRRAYGTERTTQTGVAVAAAAVIGDSFPESYRETNTIADIPAFAFPCDFSCDSVQSYSFVLTTDDSKWRYGFCRHDPKTDSAMVLITFLPWHDIFLRLLSVLAELRRSDNAEFHSFLSEAYSRGLPDPGGSLTFYYSGVQSSFVLERPAQFQLPSIPENQMLSLYYNFVDPKNMIAVFAAMLAERRIIFTSRRLDRLSSCIQAANAFLYPMVWQHIFIPVLPMKLKDYLSAPMPYLIGVPHMVLETMTPEELGEVAILDCDTKVFESPFDDVREMPADIVSQLKKQLSHTHEHLGDRVSKIFLGVLVQLIGGYRDAIEFHDTGKIFNRERYIETRPAHLRPFLAKMMELQIFQQFIDERIDMMNSGLGFSDEFEMETVRYAEKMKKRGKNYAFLKNVKDKVKEGSRGVKTAYKDLKSKLRDITPPNNNNNNNSFGIGSSYFRSHLSTTNSQHDRIDGFIGGVKSSIAGRHSAPSSPIFLHHRASNHHSGTAAATGFQYAPAAAITHARHRTAAPVPLSLSSSSSHIQPNGYVNYVPTAAAAPVAIATAHLASASPTVSPASSQCSSEMNLSQELQNHPLFKSPLVDRSSLRSLQPHHLQPNSHASQQHRQTGNDDLISLDDSTNTSFDLEDFDPLNQNARPLPQLSAMGRRHVCAAQKATTLPSCTAPLPPMLSTANAVNASSVSNPLYPYYTPPAPILTQHICTPPLLLPPSAKPPPPPAGVQPYIDDDVELLRKYGLDQFTLRPQTAPPPTVTSTTTTTSATPFRHNTSAATNKLHAAAASASCGGAAAAAMSNWTTFD